MNIENALITLLAKVVNEAPTDGKLPSGYRRHDSQERYPIADSSVDLIVAPRFNLDKKQEWFEFAAVSRSDDGLFSSHDVLGLLELVRVVASGYAEMPGETDITRVIMDWLEKGIFDLQVNLHKMYGMAERGIVLPRRAA